jgi:xanthine dehydrogenase YagS FAD-binding subunit
MQPFSYTRVDETEQAIAILAANPKAAYIAGSTTLLDLMKDNVSQPDHLVDITSLPLRGIEVTENHVRIGALTTMNDLAHASVIRERFPVISEALFLSASPQLRNMATIGGNLLQRTRCSYFRDPAFACNKRVPGTGCAALTGPSRSHAILGTSEQCIATHASDVAVALVALDTVVLVRGPQGERRIPLTDFYLMPDTTPQREHDLAHGELIIAIEIPLAFNATRSSYLKVRDRKSYEFALTSAAVALELDGTTIRAARLALGGVGTVPWRLREAEAALQGKTLNQETLTEVAEVALSGAIPRHDNAFKVELAKRTLLRQLTKVGGLA